MITNHTETWRDKRVAVSAILITYNQEKYVAQALQSVLSQTYPLDIVISDDCSTDGTVLIISDVLRDYQGIHQVTLRFGNRNLGICQNQNEALQLTQGELVVLFEGDDVSHPNRVELIVDMYLHLGRRVGALGSAIRKMNDQGERGDEVVWPRVHGDAWNVARGEWTVAGCGLAIRRDCFSEVGPISRHLISGDIALWTRAAFLEHGGLAQLPQVLVDYRIHGDNTSRKYMLDYSSLEAFKASCRRLLKNEVAQVFELRKIARYRPSLRNDPAWVYMLRVAKLRARLVLAVSRRGRVCWIWPSLRCVPNGSLRSLGIRTLVMSVLPVVRRLYRTVPLWR
jgi:glycosyltransferase involved in cell wall biosynthesis